MRVVVAAPVVVSGRQEGAPSTAGSGEEVPFVHLTHVHMDLWRRPPHFDLAHQEVEDKEAAPSSARSSARSGEEIPLVHLTRPGAQWLESQVREAEAGSGLHVDRSMNLDQWGEVWYGEGTYL